MTTIVAALVAASVAVTGWFIGHQLTTRREDRIKRLDYAPLVFLLKQLNAAVEIRDRIENEKKIKLGEIPYKKYFLPIHKEIIGLLKTKIHLLEGITIPPTFMAYVAHFTSENLAWRLAEENVEAWDFMTRLPERFAEQLEEDLKLINQRYVNAIQELRHGAFAKGIFQSAKGPKDLRGNNCFKVVVDWARWCSSTRGGMRCPLC